MKEMLRKLQTIILVVMFVFPGYNLKEKHTKQLRIYKGKTASKSQFPYFAQLLVTFYKNTTLEASLGCGGTLIHPQWILTAAHCFIMEPEILAKALKEDLIKVYMGSNKRYDDKLAVRNTIVEVHIHPLFYYQQNDVNEIGRVDNDVAVAKLKNFYPLTKTIQVVTLPSQNFYPLGQTTHCKKGTIMGVGEISKFPNVKHSSKVLYATIKALTLNDLPKDVPEPCVQTVFYSRVKFQGKQSHSMKGDSGGPYICNVTQKGKTFPVQYGIDSHVTGNPNYDYKVTVYEEVEQHMWFIGSIVKNVRILKLRKQKRMKMSRKRG